jgi:molecular chaperone GrpE
MGGSLNSEDEREETEEEQVQESGIEIEEAKGERNELVEQLRAELIKVSEQAKDYSDKYLRTLAEMDNQRKRALREKEEIQKFANERLILEILPVIDNFERAVEAGEGGGIDEKMTEGVKMILKQLREILEKEGVKAFESIGEKFDPYKHEALLAIESDKHEPSTILEEIQKGYVMKNRVIRPAKVTVSKQDEEKKEDDENGGEGKSNRD